MTTNFANGRLEQLVAADLHPGHLDGARIAGRARREQVIDHEVGIGARRSAHSLEVRGGLYEADGTHERLAHHDADVGARVALGLERQFVEVLLAHRVGRVAQM